MTSSQRLEPSSETAAEEVWLPLPPPAPGAGKSGAGQRVAAGLPGAGLLDSEAILSSPGPDARRFATENYSVVFILRFLTLVLNLAGVFSFKMY